MSKGPRLRTPLLLIAGLLALSFFSPMPFTPPIHASPCAFEFAQENLSILSFATNPKHPMLELLRASSPYPIEVLGLHQKWRFPRDKLEAVKKYLEQHQLKHSKKIILFVDGYDTFFAPHPQNILRKFKAFHKPLVLSAEMGCWPLYTPACIHKDSYPQSPTPFRYVNSGTYMGYASAIYKMLERVLREYPQEKDDQYLLHHYFLENQDKVALDYHQAIFALLYGTSLSDYRYHPETGAITQLKTHSTPVVFHGNGGPAVKKMFLELHKLSHHS